MPPASTPYPQSLPLSPFALDTPTHDAYEECLLLEQKNGWNEFADDFGRDFFDTTMSDLPPVTVARVLGHALRLAPSADDRDVLTREIVDCRANPTDLHCSPELLAGLAHLYVYGMIRVFYNPKGPTPSVSTVQSPMRSFEEVRQRTLIRDENRCVFTGDLDITAGLPLPGAGLILDPSRALRVSKTNVAHIISQSLSLNIDGMTQAAREKFNWALTAAAVLERFGGFSAYDVLGDDNLNSAANAFTAIETPHALFDHLNLWLVPAQDETGNRISNTYDVRYPESMDPQVFQLTGVRRRISFRSVTLTDGTVVPPPHPCILALHAVCAQVAHLSGAVEYVTEFYCDSDPEGISVMTEPNAPAELVRKLKTLQLI